MKTILNLIILNLIQVILTVVTILLLTSCAPPDSAPLWLRATETLPQVEGFSRAGLFTINGKIYVQFCDPNGNQKWLDIMKANIHGEKAGIIHKDVQIVIMQQGQKCRG